MRVELSKHYSVIQWAKTNDRMIAAVVAAVLPFIASLGKRYFFKEGMADATARGLIDGVTIVRKILIVQMAIIETISMPMALLLIIASIFAMAIEKRIANPEIIPSLDHIICGHAARVATYKFIKNIAQNPQKLLFYGCGNIDTRELGRAIGQKTNCLLLSISAGDFLKDTNFDFKLFFESINRPIIIFIRDGESLMLKSNCLSLSDTLEMRKLEFRAQINSLTSKRIACIVCTQQKDERFFREFTAQVDLSPPITEEMRLAMREKRSKYFKSH